MRETEADLFGSETPEDTKKAHASSKNSVHKKANSSASKGASKKKERPIGNRDDSDSDWEDLEGRLGTYHVKNFNISASWTSHRYNWYCKNIQR